MGLPVAPRYLRALLMVQLLWLTPSGLCLQELTSLPFADGDAEVLDDWLSKQVKDVDAPGAPVPGVQVAVAKVDYKTGNVKLLGQGVYGVRRLGSPEKLLATDSMRIGSCTKPFVSTLMAILVQKGLVSYEDTLGDLVGKYIPDMATEFKPIKLKEVLSHTAGIIRDYDNLPDATMAKLNGVNKSGPRLSFAEGRALYTQLFLSETKPKNRGKFKYSNCGATLAGFIVDKHNDEGLTFEQMLDKYVIGPLGLQGISWANLTQSVTEPSPSAAYGHWCVVKNKQATLIVDVDSYEDRGVAYNAEGGLNMPMSQLVKWMAWHLRGHKGFVIGDQGSSPTQSSFLLMHTAFQKPKTPGEGYGFFWETDSYWHEFYHTGLVESFNTQMDADLDTGIVVALSTNFATYDEAKGSPCYNAYDAETFLTDMSDALVERYAPSGTNRRRRALRTRLALDAGEPRFASAAGRMRVGKGTKGKAWLQQAAGGMEDEE